MQLKFPDRQLTLITELNKEYKDQYHTPPPYKKKLKKIINRVITFVFTFFCIE